MVIGVSCPRLLLSFGSLRDHTVRPGLPILTPGSPTEFPSTSVGLDLYVVGYDPRVSLDKEVSWVFLRSLVVEGGDKDVGVVYLF